MRTIFIGKDLIIKHRRHRNRYELFINYKHFDNKMKELYKTNVFFTTYLEKNAKDGFLKVANNLYVRLLVKHRLGAIGEIEDDIKNKHLLKVGISVSKKQLVLFIFPDIFNKINSGYYEEKFNLNIPSLGDFYIDLTIASSYELIKQRKSIKSVRAREAFHQDLLESVNKRIKWSQNADGGRKNLEILTGIGNNNRRKTKEIGEKDKDKI